jgi:hypothetical protein
MISSLVPLDALAITLQTSSNEPRQDPTTASWQADAHNPVVTGGSLFSRICAGSGKHCTPGTVDEGTPQIVEIDSAGAFVVTFHGYDYGANSAVRGVARTNDWLNWDTAGGGLPNDAIFSKDDCNQWNMPWAAGGCIGSGEASILRAPSGYMYEIIEATDVSLMCKLDAGVQWWPMGLVRSRTFAPSPQWEEFGQRGAVSATATAAHTTGSQLHRALHLNGTHATTGTGGTSTTFIGVPHQGCALQYSSMWQETAHGATWCACALTLSLVLWPPVRVAAISV